MVDGQNEVGYLVPPEYRDEVLRKLERSWERPSTRWERFVLWLVRIEEDMMRATFKKARGASGIHYEIVKGNGKTVCGFKLSTLAAAPAPMESKSGETYEKFRRRVLSATIGGGAPST